MPPFRGLSVSASPFDPFCQSCTSTRHPFQQLVPTFENLSFTRLLLHLPRQDLDPFDNHILIVAESNHTQPCRVLIDVGLQLTTLLHPTPVSERSKMSLVQSELQPSKHSCVISLVKESTSNSKANHGEDNIHSSNVSLSNVSTATCNQSVVQSLANDGSYGREVLRLPIVSSECTASLFSPRNIEVDQLKNSVVTSSAIRSLVTFPPTHEPDATSISTASTLLAESPVPPLTPDNCSVCDDCADEERTRALKLALEFKTIRNLKPEHDAVRARFFLHQAKQTESLRNNQDSRRKRLQESHQSSIESLEEQVKSYSSP